MKTAFGVVNLPSMGLVMTLYLRNTLNLTWFQQISNAFHCFCQYCEMVSNLSYAMHAFVIAAPIPDNAPTNENT